MKMPDKCCECRFDRGGWCMAVDSDVRENRTRLSRVNPKSFCPLRQFPIHGRLIDADALIKELSLNDEDGNNGATLLMEIFIEVLKGAPTVIPSNRKDGE